LYRTAAEVSHLEGLVAVFEAGAKAQRDDPETAKVSNG